MKTMKKKYRLMVGVLMFFLPFTVGAQELVWSNTFNNASDLQGWILHDLDGNDNGYIQGNNWYLDKEDSYKTKEGTQQVLRYANFGLDGTYVPNSDQEDNWIISPAIDLTNAEGTIQLAIYWNKMDSRKFGVGRLMYVSESQNLESFQQQYNSGAMSYYFGDDDVTPSGNPNEFVESIIDISAFEGKKIYIGIVSDATNDYAALTTSWINIDEMAVYATEVSGTLVTGVSLNKTTLSLVVGTDEILTAAIAPADATNKEVTWSSSNEAVATVDATGKVTAIAPGTATITVTTTDGSKNATCALTVTTANSYAWLEAAVIAVEGNTAKVVGANAGTFTKFFVNTTETAGNIADLTGVTGTVELKATSADGTQVIKLKINK